MTKRKPAAKKKTTAPAATTGAVSLTRRQELFVLEFMVDNIATQAAIRAGYGAKWAGSNADKLLKNPKVRARIDAAIKERYSRLDITVERITAELARGGFFDIRKLYRPGTNILKPISELDDDTAAAISSVEVLEEFSGNGADRHLVGYTKKIKLVDKKGCLELLGKTLKMFVERKELSGPNGGAIPVTQTADLTNLNMEQLRALEIILQAAAPPPAQGG